MGKAVQGLGIPLEVVLMGDSSEEIFAYFQDVVGMHSRPSTVALLY